jgi:fibronectin-binding autotransporter adhesin
MTREKALTRWRLFALLLLAFGVATADAFERSHVWDGSENGLWLESGNWALSRGPTPGDDLTFPSSGFWKTTVNNYPVGTTFGRITYSGAGYEVFGNRLGLSDGLIATHTSGVTTFGPEVGLAGNIFFTAQSAGTRLDLLGLVTLSNAYGATFAGAGLVQVSNAVRRVPNFAGGVAIIKDGTGTALLTKSNDLNGGAVLVRGGTLALAHHFALGDAGTTIVSNGATLALSGNVRLDSGPITLAGTLRSDLGANVTLDPITLSGANAAFDVPGSLTVSGVVAGAVGFTKLGGSGLWLRANNTYSGPTALNQGLLVVDGIQPGSAIMLNGGILGGRGTVGPIISLMGGGLIDKSGGAETQSCGGLELNGATTIHLSVIGAGSGPRASQLVVNGPVNLGGSILAVQFHPTSFSPVAGDSILIVRNDDLDPIVGTFANLPEGAVTNLSSGEDLICRVSYAGGDGNDVVLTVLPNQRIWEGSQNGNWNDPGNWESSFYAPKPGDDLIFPAGAARLSTTNNLGLNIPFHSVVFTGNGYTLHGNQILLRNGVVAAMPSSTNRIALPLRLETNVTFTASNGASLLILTNLNTDGEALTLAGEGEHRVSGVISGSGSLVKLGIGLATLSGSNTYSGPTQVREGTTLIMRNGALGSAAGNTVVVPGASLATIAGLDISEPLTLGGTLEHMVSSNGTCVWSGPIVLQGATPRIAVENSTLLISGVISGAGSLTKQGAGTLRLDANNVYSGTTVLSEGILQVNGQQPQSIVQFNGGTLTGSGTGMIGHLVAAGSAPKIIDPGLTFGVLITSNLLLNSFTEFKLDLNGTNPGGNHDQLLVRGTIQLGNCHLVAGAGAGLAVGQVLRIIDNDGTDAVNGTFNGVPEGGKVTASNGIILEVTYHGGDGNDVEVRIANPPSIISSVSRTPEGFMEVRGQGFPNVLYTLEASTTLLPGSWAAITVDLADAAGLYELVDVDAGTYPRRFYRVSSP